MRVALGNVELAGTFGESVFGLRYSAPRQLQISPVFRAPPKVFDRGAGLARINFSVTRQHASASAALEFIRDHPLAIAEKVGEAVEFSLVLQGQQFAGYLDQAHVEVTDASFQGVSTTHSYQIVGTEMSTTPES